MVTKDVGYYIEERTRGWMLLQEHRNQSHMYNYMYKIDGVYLRHDNPFEAMVRLQSWVGIVFFLGSKAEPS